jgi:hypothetical protein
LFNTGFESDVVAVIGVVLIAVGSAATDGLEIALLGAILDLSPFVETVVDLTFFEETVDLALMITSSICEGVRTGISGGVGTLTGVIEDLIDRISLPAFNSIKLMSRKIEIINK